MMRSDENVAVSTDNTRDSLETITGIGPTFSKALHKIGIHRFEDLAQCTPQDLSQVLLEQAGVRVSPERIEAKNWIGQAGALARNGSDVLTPPAEETRIKLPGKAPNPSPWHQHAGFSVFFDLLRDELGNEAWQTRVYHDESDQETLFSGIETAPWVNWILERAKLPVTTEPTPTETEVSAPPTPVAPYDARIEILDVQDSEVGPSSGIPEKRLMAEVRFRLSGAEAETLTANRLFFRVEVHTVDLESGTSNLVASGRGQLRPLVFEYASQQTFPMPELGHYELHSIVLLLPPGEIMAYHRGPTFKVIP